MPDQNQTENPNQIENQIEKQIKGEIKIKEEEQKEGIIKDELTKEEEFRVF
jgi:hypothetical protein